MLYSFTRFLVKLGVLVLYKKIKITGIENIPLDKPVFLATNHPTAFIEPAIIGSFLPKKLHFLVRGNLFNGSKLDYLLKGFGFVPIFRTSEGFSNAKKNDSTFDFCYDALKENKIIVIMIEGKTHQDKRLLPAKKGMARIAFGSIEKYGWGIDPQIIPVGVNFSKPHLAREKIRIDYGEPISLSKYKAQYEANPIRTVVKLTQDVRNEMLKRIIHIKNKEDDNDLEFVFDMLANNVDEAAFPTVERKNKLLFEELELIKKWDRFSDSMKKSIKNSINTYKIGLRKSNLSDYGIVNAGKKTPLLLFVHILVFPLAWLGRILHYFPTKLGYWIADKKVKQVEFYLPLAAGVWLGVYFSILLISMIISFVLFSFLPVVIFFGFILLGLIYLINSEFFDKEREKRQVRKQENYLKELLKIRKEIESQFKSI